MMTARQSLYVPVFMAVVAALCWAGPLGAAPPSGGLPQCQKDLNTCKTNLNTCSNDRTTCNTNLNTCTANFNQSQGNLATCTTNLNQSETNRAACEADLAACEANASAFPATGQTTLYHAGDDGDIEAGATLSYTDNGDGTITDNNTGLQWEKKSDDDSIHDKDTFYTWDQAFDVHVFGLNTDNFAGHNDWRLPNVKELQSIVNYQNFNPAVSSAFHNNDNCVAGATVLTGSCTAASNYWSSTTIRSNSGFAWLVNFLSGFVSFGGKFTVLLVRAVRGGL